MILEGLRGSGASRLEDGAEGGDDLRGGLRVDRRFDEAGHAARSRDLREDRFPRGEAGPGYVDVDPFVVAA